MSPMFLGLNYWASGRTTFKNGNNYKRQISVCRWVRGGKDQKFILAQIEWEIFVRHLRSVRHPTSVRHSSRSEVQKRGLC